MPELPEVEIYARYFARHALGQPVARVRVHDERILGVRKAALTRAVVGETFRRVQRHGKHLFADAGRSWVHFHFGMTGDLAYYRDPSDAPRFERVVFDFRDGAHLAFEDMRLFGVVDLTPSPEAYIAEHRLGPDPLNSELRLADFRRLMEPRRGRIKALLMSQEVVAGVGNLYADETLFRTGIDPRRSADRLTAGEVKAIFTTMRAVLQQVIDRKERGAGYPASFLIAHREEGARCPRCGGTIRKTIVGGRTTYYCAGHQR